MNIQDAVNKYVLSRSDCIPLVASENAMSPAVKRLCSSEIGERYCVGSEAPWKYPREELLESIVRMVRQLACDIFEGKSCTVAPLSGSQCVAAITLGICEPGDLVIGLSSDDGGHWALRGMAQKLHCHFEPLPLGDDFSVNTEKLSRLLKRKRPKLVMVDPSHSVQVIAPENIRACLPMDIPLFYDLSHFMGICPHQYLNAPFSRGVTAIHGSTHKSLFGPQKGLIVFGQQADDDLITEITIASEKLLSSNCHLHHIAALGVALEEYRAFGEMYSSAVVRHARVFAETLKQQGLELICAQDSYTQSHQVLLKLSQDAESIWKRLTKCGILANLIRLPRQHSPGLRFGLAEVTRRGYTGPEIATLGSTVARLIKNEADLHPLEIDVRELAKRSRMMKFCFD